MLKKMKDEIELLSRHIEVAKAVVDHEPIGIMKLSELLNLPSHRIRYSLHVLEQPRITGGSGCHTTNG
jgi:predicted transcriptional regulator